MLIKQIKSPIIAGAALVGKWFCSVAEQGTDNHPVHRYLQANGEWGKTTHYFDNEDQIQTALSKGIQPDFTLSERDRQDRAMIRDDIERGFDVMDEWDVTVP